MKFYFSIFLSVFLANIFAGLGLCHAQKPTEPKSFYAGFYNMENLFDTEDDPAIDDAEFLPNGKYAWTPERYQKKLQNMAYVIANLPDTSGPAILGVCEVENAKVLADLCAEPSIAPKGYKFVHENSPDQRGIDVALLYRPSVFKLLNYRYYVVNLPGPDPYPTRSILLVKGQSGADTLWVMVNHWPSRRGGEGVSIGKRKAAATVARHLCDSLLAKDFSAKILIMGDFNDEPTDSSVAYVLGASESGRNTPLTNILASLTKSNQGSHFYDKKWNLLDQLLLSKGLARGRGLHYKKGKSGVFHADFLKQQTGKYAGNPFRTYAGNKYLGGYSDHMPVWLELQRR